MTLLVVVLAAVVFALIVALWLTHAECRVWREQARINGELACYAIDHLVAREFTRDGR